MVLRKQFSLLVPHFVLQIARLTFFICINSEISILDLRCLLPPFKREEAVLKSARGYTKHKYTYLEYKII